MKPLVEGIRPGDRVTIVDRFGKQRSGRAVMRGSHGWVLNMGGKHGTPGIADDRNIIKVSTKRGTFFFAFDVLRLPRAERGGLGSSTKEHAKIMTNKRAPRGVISLIVKGPVKSAKRAGARHGVSMESCRAVGTGKFGDVQCYARCHPSTNDGVAQWFGSRVRSKPKRGFPPGTLLYHGTFCSKDLSGASPRRRRRRTKRK